MSLKLSECWTVLACCLCALVAIVAKPVVAGELAWKSGPGGRSAPLSPGTISRPGFSLLPSERTGISFSNRLSRETVATNRLLELGSGVTLGDVDGDGWVDIYFCRLQGGNALFRNLGGWRFEDVTEAAGVACPGQFSTGCALADVDGDGDLDLLVTGLGAGTREWMNNGSGRFSELTNTPLQRLFGATSLALADVEGDGDLDLYVCNYRTDTFFDHPAGLVLSQSRLPDGRTVAVPIDRFLTLTNADGGPLVVEKGEPDIFYINRGGGRFFPVSWSSGMFRDEEGKTLTEPPRDWGLAVMFRDVNGDGLPDLYVCNDFVHWPDRVWINDRGRRFRAAPALAFRNSSLSSMAVDIADINRDGLDDLFVADMLNPRREARAWQRPDTLSGVVRWPVDNPIFRPEVPRNTLHLARGNGTFAEIAQLAGVADTDWTWSATFLDVDLDGWEDLLLATGASHDVQDSDVLPEISRTVGWRTVSARLQAFGMLPSRAARSLAFRNRRDLTFEDSSQAWGFDGVGVAHGMALGDLDNDGDLDVVINCLNSPARIYQNLSSAPRLAVRLRGTAPNTRGIGAKITVRGGPVTQTQEMLAGGRYLSGDDPVRVFAAGNAKALEIEVVWRSGKRSRIQECLPNHLFEIDESLAESKSEPAPTAGTSLFEDVSNRVNHQHQDEPFDDFMRQSLLPRSLSSLGPGVGWFDVNGDGAEDLLVAGGKGGRMAVLLNDHKGSFSQQQGLPETEANTRDQTTVLAWRDTDGAVRGIVGESSWEAPTSDKAPLLIRAFGADSKASPIAGVDAAKVAVGPLALADVDGDGDLDLFVGGRAVPGRYPEPADSHLLRNQSGSFSSLQLFERLGLVSDAVFIDFDDDGDPDLAVACEWGPIRLFRNEAGRLSEITDAVGLSAYTGLWNGIAVGDLDGDGRLDLVASNWGRNWRTDHHGGEASPVELFYGDLAGDGVVQTLIASHDPLLGMVTPWAERKRVVAVIPSIGAAFPTHRAYAAAGISRLLGEQFASCRKLQALTTDSMIFLNRGTRFEAKPLPPQAQFAAAFGVCVADFNGDGDEDLFLAQNFFGMDVAISRQDAGLGLILTGDGRGAFRPLSPSDSGIAIYGEQRGSAVADFDGDGRVDLAVTQHSGQTKLFRNQAGLSGRRVRLKGSLGNPDGIGGKIRVRLGDRWSRAIELRAGGGYWSQNSVGAIFASSTPPNAVQIRWPGGLKQEWPWPGESQSIEVSQEGVKAR